MLSRTLVLVIIALGCGASGALAACASSEVTTVGPQKPKPAPPGAIARPFVQAGTVFSVTLDQPLDTRSTPPGTIFSATVDAPLVANDGRVLVPAGAKVTGEMVTGGTELKRQLRLELISIDTVAGKAPIDAAVRSAEHVAWSGPQTVTPRSSYGPRPYSADMSSGATQPTEPLYGYEMETPREVHLPRGAPMELELVRPLVMP